MMVEMRWFLVVVTLVAMAHADEPTAESMFAEGRAYLAENKFVEASDKLTEALTPLAYPSRPIPNLGLCNDQLDRLATALRWFRRAQVRGSELNLTEAETAAKAKIAALLPRVATLRL